MPHPRFSLLTLLVFALTPVLTAHAAVHEKILHAFTGSPDGAVCQGGLISDSAGNLYGTTMLGGANNFGSVFELSLGSNGKWTTKVLYSFSGDPDGGQPVAGLVLDGTGNLYGTTTIGGVNNVGTVFELSPKSGGGWTESILYSFAAGQSDGGLPEASLVLDSAGNLYGTTYGGGPADLGSVFQLKPGKGGKWAETVLHLFSGGKDGSGPEGNVAVDSAGNVYGLTSLGGSKGSGTAFAVIPGSGGKWTEKIIHNFGIGKDGIEPHSGLVSDASGNLYGTTRYGGTGNQGIVFRLAPKTGGGWTESRLHSFKGKSSQPFAGISFDSLGNIYGGTVEGGVGDGMVYVLKFNATKGVWIETDLHNFKGGKDGIFPYAAPIVDASGNLYGTTYGGGPKNYGTVYEITP